MPRQILELQSEQKIETPRRRAKIQLKPPYPMKLSKIWEQASKELNQTKIEFGDASSREACAMGAISFYLSGKKTCFMSELRYAWQRAVFRDMVKTFESRANSSIWELNDVKGWTFAQFAEKANELDL